MALQQDESPLVQAEEYNISPYSKSKAEKRYSTGSGTVYSSGLGKPGDNAYDPAQNQLRNEANQIQPALGGVVFVKSKQELCCFTLVSLQMTFRAQRESTVTARRMTITRCAKALILKKILKITHQKKHIPRLMLKVTDQIHAHPQDQRSKLLMHKIVFDLLGSDRV